MLSDIAARIRRESAQRSVTISCTFGFASLWLVPRLMEFRELHPDIDIRIAADNNCPSSPPPVPFGSISTIS
ncbi:MAG: hypothetical protein H0T52_01500 [Lautropia sp.]|nr:hypothetical protein [Lautropia sp.]